MLEFGGKGRYDKGPGQALRLDPDP